jgi:hypothetical protein
MRKQTAVWWARLAPDHCGAFVFADPVEIDCRWDDRQEEYRNTEGQILLSQAVVYVDREMTVGDKLKKGDLESNMDDPKTLDGAFEIKSFQQIPNLKATETLYIAHL